MSVHRNTFDGNTRDVHGYIRGFCWAVIITGTAFIGFVIGRLT